MPHAVATSAVQALVQPELQQAGLCAQIAITQGLQPALRAAPVWHASWAQPAGLPQSP